MVDLSTTLSARWLFQLIEYSFKPLSLCFSYFQWRRVNVSTIFEYFEAEGFRNLFPIMQIRIEYMRNQRGSSQSIYPDFPRHKIDKCNSLRFALCMKKSMNGYPFLKPILLNSQLKMARFPFIYVRTVKITYWNYISVYKRKGRCCVSNSLILAFIRLKCQTSSGRWADSVKGSAIERILYFNLNCSWESQYTRRTIDICFNLISPLLLRIPVHFVRHLARALV